MRDVTPFHAFYFAPQLWFKTRRTVEVDSSALGKATAQEEEEEEAEAEEEKQKQSS